MERINISTSITHLIEAKNISLFRGNSQKARSISHEFTTCVAKTQGRWNNDNIQSKQYKNRSSLKSLVKPYSMSMNLTCSLLYSDKPAKKGHKFLDQ